MKYAIRSLPFPVQALPNLEWLEKAPKLTHLSLPTAFERDEAAIRKKLRRAHVWFS